MIRVCTLILGSAGQAHTCTSLRPSRALWNAGGCTTQYKTRAELDCRPSALHLIPQRHEQPGELHLFAQREESCLAMAIQQFNFPPVAARPERVIPQEPYFAVSGRTAPLTLQETPWEFFVNGRRGIRVAQALAHDMTGLAYAENRLILPPQEDLGDKGTIRVKVRQLCGTTDPALTPRDGTAGGLWQLQV